jgi:hypothetical protein
MQLHDTNNSPFSSENAHIFPKLNGGQISVIFHLIADQFIAAIVIEKGASLEMILHHISETMGFPVTYQELAELNKWWKAEENTVLKVPKPRHIITPTPDDRIFIGHSHAPSTGLSQGRKVICFQGGERKFEEELICPCTL